MSRPTADEPPTELDDGQFLLAELDEEWPGSQSVLSAAKEGDEHLALVRFAQLLRRSLNPGRYLSLPLDLGDNAFMHPGEDMATAALRILEGERVSTGVPHRFANGVIDWDANPTPEGYREWTWQLNRHREWVVLAQEYRRSRDERFARKVVEELRGWTQQAPVPSAAPGDSTTSWRTIEAGIRAGASWPWALHALLESAELDDRTLVRWARSYWDHGWRLRSWHRTGNWLVLEMNGLAHVGILFPMFRRAGEWLDYSLAKLASELSGQVYPDGFQYELSTHTHQILLRQYVRLEEVCARYEVPVPGVFATGLERAFDVDLKMRMPDGRLPNLNNGAWHEVSKLLEPAASRYPEREDLKWAVTGGREGEEPSYCSWSFPYSGYTVFRSDWSPNGVWALFDGGPYGFRHHHEDKLNMLLFAHGRLLLTEAGKHRFDESPMHHYTLASRGHNTMLVDGHGQNRKARFVPANVDVERPAGLHAWLGGAVEVADAVYDEGYGPEAAISVSHSRRVFFFRDWPGLPVCLVVVDRCRSWDGASHTFEALWHLAADEVGVEGTQARTVDPDVANLQLLTSGQEPLTLIRGQTDPEWRGWRVPDQGPALPTPCPTVVARWQGTNCRRLYLLEPVPPNSEAVVRGVTGDAEHSESRFSITVASGATFDFDERRLLEGA